MDLAAQSRHSQYRHRKAVLQASPSCASAWYVGCCAFLRENRRRMSSVSAVPTLSAVAYFTIWSYCWAISSQLIGAPSTGARFGYRLRPPVSAGWSFCEWMAFRRGRSWNPSRRQKAKATSLWPLSDQVDGVAGGEGQRRRDVDELRALRILAE